MVKNIRGKEDNFTLDVSGVQYYTHESQCKNFSNDSEIREIYYPESTELIKKLTGASKVVLFDH
ncbi:hypothetical protein H0H87_008899, partial [Tephrocybe sp. NHM501043]